MHKRILSVLLVLAMVLSFVPVTVVTAAGTVEASPKAGTHTDAGHSDDCGLTSGWTEWTDATSLPTEGQIVLKTNVAMTKEVVMTGDLTICLNGYVVTAKNGRRLIGTKSDAETTLTICDCTAYEEDGVYYAGALTGGSDESTGGGGAVFVRRGGTFKLYDGRITGNQHKYKSAGGGAVMLQAKSTSIPTGGKLCMYGGEISHNHAFNADATGTKYGGAIYANTGSIVEITGGKLTGNEGSYGGAIYAIGATVTIKNAELSDNTGTEGGGVYAGAGTSVQIEECELNDNTAGKGGAVYAFPGAAVTVKNAEITGNTGSAIYLNTDAEAKAVSVSVEDTVFTDNEGASGGAIHARANATVNVKGCTFTGNTATNGSAIYGTKGSGTPSTAVGAVINVTDTVITGNTGTSDNAVGRSAAIFMDSLNKLSLSGKVIIAGNTMGLEGIPDVVQSATMYHTLYINNMTDGSRVNFRTTGYNPTEAKEIMALNTQQTDPWQSGWVTYTDKAGNTKDVGLVNGEFVWGHYHGDQAYTALANADQLIAGGHYYLAGDVKLDKEAYIEKNTLDLTVCLNGHTLTPANNSRILETGDHDITRNIVIDDCTAFTDSKGVYHAGAITGAKHDKNGGVFALRGGTHLILEDGKISGNQGGSGGAIILWGTMTMNGGELSDNQAGATTNKSGGAVYLNNRNTVKFTMNGGTIQNNRAANGGAIYHNGSETVSVTLNGGTITDNTATTYGGAIYMVKAASMKVSGELDITGNTAGDKANNIHMRGDGTSAAVLQPENLHKDSRIGVTLHPARISAGVMAFSTELAADPGNFTSDDSAYKVELKDKKLTLTENTVTPPPVQGHTHNGCNDDACTDHAKIVYQAWTDPKALPTEGNWYLDTDVTVEQTIAMGENTNKTINICLNGHTITQKAGTNAQMYQTTKAGSGVKISIADCTAKTENGVYTAGKITGFIMDSVTEGSVMYLRNGTTLDLFDGIFENNKTIKKSAGVLMLDCTFNMYGGMFVGNVAGDCDYNGGAIYLNRYSKATITGGIFKNNSAKQGGAIHFGRDEAHVLENVTFIDNYAKEVGGALNLGNSTGKTTILKNCAFENNAADMKGGAVRVSGVARIEDCTFTGNKGGKGAIFVSDGSDLTLAGKQTFTGHENDLYIEAEEIIHLDNISGTIGVIAATPGRAFTSDCADFSSNVVSNTADYKVTHKDGKLWLDSTFDHTHCICGVASCTQHEQVSFMPWTDAATLPASGSYCLMTDVTLTDEHTISGDLDLCLNGHTITTSVQKRLMSMPNAAMTLAITDCTAKTEDGVYAAGKLTGGVDMSSGGGGAIFVRAGSTLKLYQGILTGNKTMRDGGGGGAIMLQSYKGDLTSAFYMYGGEISGNQACSLDGTPDRLGGGIYAYQKSVFVMEGGTIKNNQAGTGAGIYAANATLTIAGEVTGNTASVAGGGIYLEMGATITVDGKVNIVGNTANGKASNLRLDGEQKIGLDTLDPAAKIAVTGQPLSYITDKCSDLSANFLSDNAKYAIVYQDGAIYLDAAGNHKHCLCVAASKQCDHTQQTFVEWDDPTTLPTSGNYFLSVDVELKGQATLSDSELNLCLNGHTIKVVGNDTRAFYTKGDAILRITDCAEKAGTITGGTRGAILTESNTESAALIELWNGVISGNTSTSVGGAILIQGAATLNMYGGKLTGNALHCKLKLDENGKPILDSKGAQTVTSTRGGGAVGVYGEKTTFNMYGGEIVNNKTTRVTYLDKNGKSAQTGGYGGGVYVCYGTFNMYGGKIANNTAEGSGGGLFTQSCTIYLENTTISGNYAGTSGGAAYFTTGSKVTLKNFTVSGNSAKSSAGGLMANGKNTHITMQGSTITGNNAGGSAGGMLVQGRAELVLQNSRITNNYAKASGGGMYISTRSALTMSGSSMTNNTANGQGGGLYLNKATVTITNSSISYNTAVTAGAGGLKLTGGSLYASGMRVIGNKAEGSGGGIVTAGSSLTENGVKIDFFATCKMYGCTVADNVSNGSGGGLLHQSKGTVAVAENCTFTGNKAASSGGGMYISSNVTFTMKDCKINDNEATAAGGFRLNSCKVVLENVEVANNVALTSSGGGAYAAGATTAATFKNLDIHGNTASSGAGLLIQKQAQVTILDSKFYENTATSNAGGGVYMSSGGIAEMSGVEIYKNKAAKMGGAIHASAGVTVVADDLHIHHNHAGEFGGGMNCGADLTLTNSVIEMNTTDGSGGGLSTTTSSSQYTEWRAGNHISDCQIIDNTAGATGGAIYIHRGGPLDLTNVTISGNEAGLEGGAIYADGRMMLTDVTITENTSLAGKYTVYLTPADSDGHSYYSGYKTLLGTIVIKDNEGGGVYMAEGIPLVIEGTLGADSYIPVTLSDGVLTQRVLGVYHYEGEGLTYTITAGDRSITDPMAPEGAQEAQEDAQNGNVLLYVGVGVFALAAVAVILMLAKKKKAKAKQN